MNESQNLAVGHTLPDSGHHHLVDESVEEGGNVRINDEAVSLLDVTDLSALQN